MDSPAMERAVQSFRAGSPIVLRDNFRDMGVCAIPSALITPRAVNFLVTNSRGILYVIMEPGALDSLKIPVHPRSDRGAESQHVPVDAAVGTTTGISADDRALTIRALADPSSLASDFLHPGHVTPIAARQGGLETRMGLSEALLDLNRAAVGGGSVTICAILDEDGSLAKQPALAKFSIHHSLPFLSIADVVRYKRHQQGWLEPAAPTLEKVFDIPLRDIRVAVRARNCAKARSHVDVSVRQLCVARDVLRLEDCVCAGPENRVGMDQLSSDVIALWWHQSELSIRCQEGPPAFEEGLREVLAADLVGGHVLR